MKTKDDFAIENGYEDWDNMFYRLENYPLRLRQLVDEAMELYAEQKWNEVIAKFDSEIQKLQNEKDQSRKIDDMYSWHISNDQQEVWKSAKNIFVSSLPPTFKP